MRIIRWQTQPKIFQNLIINLKSVGNCLIGLRYQTQNSVPLFAIVLLQLCMYLCTFGFLNYAQIRRYAKYVQRNFYFFINNLRNHIGSICAVNSGGILLIKYLFFSFDWLIFDIT